MKRCLFLRKKLASCNLSFYKEFDRQVGSFQDGYFVKIIQNLAC